MNRTTEFPSTPEEWYEKTGHEAGVVRFGYDPSIRRWHYLTVLISVPLTALAVILTTGVSWIIMVGAFVVVFVIIGICEVNYRQQSQRSIEIDYEKSVVRIAYFIYPLHFFDIKPKPEVVIPFEIVHSVWTFSGRGQSKTFVHTTDSRFAINDCFHRRFELVKRLTMIAKEGEQPVNKPIVGQIVTYVVIIFIVAAILFAADMLGIV